MAQLTPDELREAAAEAGVSPHELQTALAKREGVAPALVGGGNLLPANPRGHSSAHAEGALGLPPAEAVAAVRQRLERQTGLKGHGQGRLEADVVDDRAGLTYRIRAEDDGAGGALVRVDMDTTAAAGYTAMIVSAAAAVGTFSLGVAWLFSSWIITFIALGALGGAGFAYVRGAAGRARALTDGRAQAARAMLDAEAAAPALPPAGGTGR